MPSVPRVLLRDVAFALRIYFRADCTTSGVQGKSYNPGVAR